MQSRSISIQGAVGIAIFDPMLQTPSASEWLKTSKKADRFTVHGPPDDEFFTAHGL